MTWSSLIAAGAEPAEGTVTAGAVGAIFFGLMAIASFLLWWNMDQRLKRMRRREQAEMAGSDETDATSYQ